MVDLVCTDCGHSTTYADASIADMKRSCHNNSLHTWAEKLHPEIDVV